MKDKSVCPPAAANNYLKALLTCVNLGNAAGPTALPQCCTSTEILWKVMFSLHIYTDIFEMLKWFFS